MTLTPTTEQRATLETIGHLQSVRGSLYAHIKAALGEQVQIRIQDGELVAGEVIGFDEKRVQIMPWNTNARFQSDDLVIASGHSARVPVGRGLLGRVLNSSGQPIDRRGAIVGVEYQKLFCAPVESTDRPLIYEVMPTGIRAIDGFLTIGRGQRVGVFAGSGVGKSTLLSNLVKNSSADVNVIALIGERGREVRPFIELALGEVGMRRSVVVVSTSDETPISRIRAAEAAITIANDFRQHGKNVLFLMDSLTRYATSQKELGLMLGEPPASRGYPATVFQRIANLLEQLGNTSSGSITGIISVLVDGDDMNEPVADAARSILDGHIVLRRELAEQNHFPAIDVLSSVSRLFREICDDEHVRRVGEIRRTMALYKEVEDLIRIGAYKKGNVAATDRAIDSMPAINQFLRQSDSCTEFATTLSQIHALALVCQGAAA